MKANIFKNLNRFLLVVSVVYCSTFLFLILQVLLIEGVFGWDGPSHFGLWRYYHNKIFPDIYGWTTNWYRGFPLHLSYPPLTYYILSVVFSLVGLIFSNLAMEAFFKSFFLLPLVIIPIFFVFLARKFYSSTKSTLLVFIFSIAYLIDSAIFNLGANISGTFLAGLFPQLLGAVIFLIWLLFYSDFFLSYKYRFLSAFFLFCIVLTNIQVAEVAFIIVFAQLFFDLLKKEWKKVFLNTLYFFATVLLSGIWLVPAIANLPNTSVRAGDPFINDLSILIFLLSSFCIYRCFKEEDFNFLFVLNLSVFIMSFLIVFPVKKLVPFLPIQPHRLFSLVGLLTPFLFVHLLGINLRDFKYSLLGYLIKGVVFTFTLVPLVISPGFAERIRAYAAPREDLALLEYLNREVKSEAVSLIEFVQDVDYPGHQLISGKVETPTLWGVFREQSITAPYAIALRNAFSLKKAFFGINCSLCTEEFYNAPFSRRMEIANLFGVSHFAIKSKEVEDQFDAYKGSYFTKDEIGEWKVYSDAGISTDSPISSYILVVSSNNNWQSLVDWWLLRGNLQVPFVKAPGTYIEDNTHLYEHFSSILFIDADYRDLDTVKNIAERYLGNDQLFVLGASRELKEILSQVGSTEVHFLSEYDELKAPSVSPQSKGAPTYYLPVTYSPFAKIVGGSALLASPSFTVVVGSNSNIVYDFTIYEVLGGVVSLLGVFVLFLELLPKINEYFRCN